MEAVFTAMTTGLTTTANSAVDGIVAVVGVGILVYGAILGIRVVKRGFSAITGR